MKKIILSFMTLSIIIISFLQPISMAKTNENDDLAKSLFLSEVESHSIFKEYESQMLSTDPYILNDLLDENEQKKGYLAQYEVELVSDQQTIENTEEGEIYLETTITSLLTFLYNEEENVMEVLLIDYSYIELEENIYLRDLTSNTVDVISVSETQNEELAETVNEIETNQQKTMAQASQEIAAGNIPDGSEEMNPRYRPGCSYWICQQYISGGGDYSSKCTVLAGTACAFVGYFTKVGSLICHGATVIGCYVPKYKVCARGYWETKNCPIQV